MEQEPNRTDAELATNVEAAAPAAEPAPAGTPSTATASVDGSSSAPSADYPPPPAYPAARESDPVFPVVRPADARHYEVEGPARPRSEPRSASGPNWMLTIVCWIAAATSLFEAHALFAGDALRSYAFSGYLTLGLGILLFSFEALGLSGRSRRAVSWLFAPATVLTIIGVICLVMSQAPGRRI